MSCCSLGRLQSQWQCYNMDGEHTAWWAHRLPQSLILIACGSTRLWTQWREKRWQIPVPAPSLALWGKQWLRSAWLKEETAHGQVLLLNTLPHAASAGGGGGGEPASRQVFPAAVAGPAPWKKCQFPSERHSLWVERLCNHRCPSRREPPLGWWGLLIKDLLLVLYGAERKCAAVGAGIAAPQHSTSGTCLWVQGDGWWMLFSPLFIRQLHL